MENIQKFKGMEAKIIENPNDNHCCNQDFDSGVAKATKFIIKPKFLGLKIDEYLLKHEFHRKFLDD
jgi:hypothetical protein